MQFYPKVNEGVLADRFFASGGRPGLAKEPCDEDSEPSYSITDKGLARSKTIEGIFLRSLVEWVHVTTTSYDDTFTGLQVPNEGRDVVQLRNLASYLNPIPVSNIVGRMTKELSENNLTIDSIDPILHNLADDGKIILHANHTVSLASAYLFFAIKYADAQTLT